MGKTYALYVEKEHVGKRIKSSKVKVCWKFATEPDLNTVDVVLKHSLVSGKFEIKEGNKVVFSGKKSSGSKSFYHTFYTGTPANRIECSVRVEEGPDSSNYELMVNGVMFHRNPYISIMQLEEMRKQRRENEIRSRPSISKATADVQSFSYSSFVSSASNSAAAAPPEPTAAKPEVEIDLLGMGTSDVEEKNASTLDGFDFDELSKDFDAFNMDFQSFHKSSTNQNKSPPQKTSDLLVKDEILLDMTQEPEKASPVKEFATKKADSDPFADLFN